MMLPRGPFRWGKKREPEVFPPVDVIPHDPEPWLSIRKLDDWSAYGKLCRKHGYRLVRPEWYFTTKFYFFICQNCGHTVDVRESVFWKGSEVVIAEAARAHAASDRSGSEAR